MTVHEGWSRFHTAFRLRHGINGSIQVSFRDRSRRFNPRIYSPILLCFIVSSDTLVSVSSETQVPIQNLSTPGPLRPPPLAQPNPGNLSRGFPLIARELPSGFAVVARHTAARRRLQSAGARIEICMADNDLVCNGFIGMELRGYIRKLAIGGGNM
ncbi:hypothetical protein BDZ89DRAFT_1136802 [Hymenopellis radicata]|nr:hypothetical protein BDZ89DRAFT_1136802 [Hymenopellis radicata]